MRKRILRWLLGACYVVLVTLLLLNQMGVMGETRNSAISVLGTLLLGIALAVVLVLYIRVSDQMKSQSRTVMSETIPKVASQTERRQMTAALQTDKQQMTDAEELKREPAIKDTQTECDRDPQSYEEIYAFFLDTTQGYELSERELEVAWLLYRGYTNRQIGEELYIAETTVKKHVSHIYQKMEVYSRKDFRAKVRMGK